MNDPNMIVIDFFAGSGTTADSIMQLNAKDKGNRKQILIQYPEECAETTNAYKEGYKTISQVARGCQVKCVGVVKLSV